LPVGRIAHQLAGNIWPADITAGLYRDDPPRSVIGLPDLTRRIQFAACFIDKLKLRLDHRTSPFALSGQAWLAVQANRANAWAGFSERNTIMSEDIKADFVIIGAGSAGCV